MASVYPASPAVDPRLLALADQCVMCGLCLPHCPTYRIAGIEAESPRGRIALARALASGTLAPSAAALTHLDQCLACLSCQKVCPSQVQYEEILVRSRAATAPLRPAPTRLQRLLRDPVRLTRLARLAARLRSGRWLPRLARWLPPDSHLRRLAAAQPQPPRPLRLPHLRAAPAPRGTVALFRGCVASVHDRDTHAAARYLLTALGYAVVESAPAQCCGALPRHLGDIDAAARHAAATRAALQASGAEVVLVSASGCYGDLKEQVLADGTPRVVDIHAFLAADPQFAALRFRPLRARAALHLPCTQVNVVGDTAAIGRLLARIPELTVLPLPEQPRCCGAAGSYFLEHAQIAERLREEKLDQAAALAPDLLLTTNIGCRLHLGNGLRQRDAAVPVRHPLALLAQQLENAAS
ncbi:MAG: (Fe-S)-binding protein [Rhodanobacteraceae bacterium]|jgi:glycolate oxidase iron-sulfur subunit|nr:(Fe-S)-binding protein [Rhodanobacteraceae bacterium]